MVIIMSDCKSALIKNRKKVRMFYVALICTSFFSLIITLLANVPREYKYLFSLPLTFMVVLLFSLNYFLYPKMTYGYAIYFTLSIMLIRYSVSPIMTVISNNYIGTGPQPTYLEMDYAFIMMIYELIVSYTVIIVSSRYYYRKLQKYNINSEEIILYKPMFILKVFTFISVLYLMIFHKGILVPDIISII